MHVNVSISALCITLIDLCRGRMYVLILFHHRLSRHSDHWTRTVKSFPAKISSTCRRVASSQNRSDLRHIQVRTTGPITHLMLSPSSNARIIRGWVLLVGFQHKRRAQAIRVDKALDARSQKCRLERQESTLSNRVSPN